MEHKYNKRIIPNAAYLRNNMTKEERHLWYDYLQKYPIRFSRQKVLGKYIADFYCAQAKIVLELDGSQHYEEKGEKHDAIRTEYLKGYGLTVIRFSNDEIMKNFKGVCDYIDYVVTNAIASAKDNGTQFFDEGTESGADVTQ